jgi:gas vesicle protein
VEDEEYLGGFTSKNLKKGVISGYGIYITNKRIIGIKKRKWVIAGHIIGGVIGWAVAAKLTKDESRKALEELDRKKDFDVYKEEVSSIELKKPGLMRAGHLLITKNDGETIKIVVGGKKEFKALKEMMSAFKPEALRVIE